MLFSVTCLFTKAQIFTFTFAGTGACPTQGNSVTTANATVTPFSRTTVTCSATTGYFSSANWSQAASIDVTQYIEVSITANAGYRLDMQSVSFGVLSSSTGPVNGRIAHDGGTGTFTANSNFTSSTTAGSASTISWDFADFSTGSAGTVKFRIYGWGAAGSTGTLKINNFSVNGAVSLISGSGTSSQWTTSGNNISYSLGNVGIGTSTPNSNAKLDVNGNIFSSGKIAIGETDTSKFRDYSLAVNGSALFTKAVVKLNSEWADYVFDEGYKLPSLNEIERYVQLHKHLSEVPSAEEVKKNGIDLGDNQTILLKKIEELTLIVIEQNKQLESQHKRIEELEKKTARRN